MAKTEPQQRLGEGLAHLLEDEAIAQLEFIKKERTYQGSNPEYRKDAKMALGVIGGFIRLCATLENRRTNDLVEARVVGAFGADQKRLSA